MFFTLLGKMEDSEIVMAGAVFDRLDKGGHGVLDAKALHEHLMEARQRDADRQKAAEEQDATGASTDGVSMTTMAKRVGLSRGSSQRFQSDRQPLAADAPTTPMHSPRSAAGSDDRSSDEPIMTA